MNTWLDTVGVHVVENLLRIKEKTCLLIQAKKDNGDIYRFCLRPKRYSLLLIEGKR